MRIGIDMGHTLSGSDYGAVGYRKETNLTREVGFKVMQKLEKLGHAVVNCTVDSASSVSSSLSNRVRKANSGNLDLFISIHFNAGGGTGVEIYTYGASKFSQATSVLNNIVGLGYRNRGIKDGKNLYVVRSTDPKAMLIECCFVDSKNDMNMFSAEKMADAIVKGLVGKTIKSSASYNSPSKPSSSSKKYSSSSTIKKLQKALNSSYNKGLAEDGILGPKTKAALITIKQGAKGSLVKVLQEILISKKYNLGGHGADGVFGSMTKKAVMKFQQDKNLLIDAIVGPNTWSALLR